MGVSPDGSRLALALNPDQIAIITLATGASRNYAWPGPEHSSGTWIGNDKPSGQPVSWTADGRTLAFPATTESGGVTSVILLGTRPGGIGLGPGRRAVTFRGAGHVKPGPVGNALITPDGTRIVTITQRAQAASARITQFSTRTGRPVSPPLAGTASLTPWDVLWTDPSGGTLIVEGARTGSLPATVTGILRDGRFTPLPGAPLVTSNVAW
jgi:Tol biopolymer transport system component